MSHSSVDQGRRDRVASQFQQFYGDLPELFVQAPGRVDLIGSHTDYNQGFVLAQAIDRNTWIAAQPRRDKVVRLASLDAPGTSKFSLNDIDFDHETRWSNYVRGVAAVLKEEGHPLRGFDGLVDSTIPFGSGLSSSAALEVAAAVLFQALAGWEIEPLRLARLCQRAENEFVGVSSGILDQYSSLMGRQGEMLLLDARSLESELIPAGDGVVVMVCDTKAKRELAESEYEARREQCERGVEILQKHYPEVEALRDVSLEQLEEHRQEMPATVYRRCRFVVEENSRVLACAEAFSEGDHARAGQLMNESFEGARDLYEIVSTEMSAMQASIKEAPGAYGSRGAGAGFGGVLVGLVEAGSVEDFGASVRQGYRAETGIEAEVYPVQAASGAGVAFRLN